MVKLDLFLEMKRLILEYINWKILKGYMFIIIFEVKWLLKVNV